MELISRYGSELFRRAKTEETDLSTLDTEERMLLLLKSIRKYGAR
jgi:hypothetical protein